eukprot:TRINITY_DN11313_c0_g1_i1.p1 TRINITY_DN11313_c0_g1~~TRINITY_DN11313_c0_g1_i1.p1  ORF type:complete len:605 (+),score=156.66 TRINITY_DN11313_c0_g1_i1:45-1859(+)
MPVVTVAKALFLSLLEETYTDDEFSQVCFGLGVELDETIENEAGETIEYKIEVGANRYDLLCIEGLARAFRYFLGKDKDLPIYKTIQPATPQKMVINESVLSVRPVVVCAVLRGIKFTPESYDSFIALQEKLHHNICRRRTLASIGTHDLDTVEGPFSYEAIPPSEFKFIPLRQTTEVDGNGMVELLEKDEHLKDFLYMVKDKPAFPVILDAKRRILSVPPIINGEHSKISLNTKNVFIEVTGTDKTKAGIVLDMVCTMFSEYCDEKFVVEQVEVVGNDSSFTPDWSVERTVTVELDYLSRGIGLPVEKESVVEYLHKMQLPSKLSEDQKSVVVSIPPIRSDILHACDILEDVAIGYGFERILNQAVTPKTVCRGAQQPVEKLSATLSKELALAGWTEILTFSLCSRADNYDKLLKPFDDQGVLVSNACGEDFQMLRTSLYSGLLKTVHHSQNIPLPINLFEISDICLRSNDVDVGAKNQRCLCALRVDTSSGFEKLHGLLDRVMILNRVLHFLDYEKWKKYYDATVAEGKKIEGLFYDKYYRIVPDQDEVYLPGTCGSLILYNATTKEEQNLGKIGIVHPQVLGNFKIPNPVCAFHINIEPFL